MGDLVGYLNASNHPAVLRAAMAHAQFETIHPFVDGNGRTGRALIQTVLNAAGLARGAVPISTALSRDRSGYYDALNATRVVCGPDDAVARSASLHWWLATFKNACEEAQVQAASVVRAVEGIASRWAGRGGVPPRQCGGGTPTGAPVDPGVRCCDGVGTTRRH